MRTSPGHAVVLGGGWAGTLNAWAAARAGWEVTLLERERPDDHGALPTVPQGRHLHLLMPGGLTVLERLLPGITDGFLGRGAQRLRLPRDFRWLTTAGWMPPLADGHRIVCASRGVLDATVRERVLQHPQITLRTATEATGLVLSRGRFTAVRTRTRGGRPRQEEIACDLAVDATGRSSPTPGWLAEHGIAAPPEDTVDSGVGYASGFFHHTGEILPSGHRALFLQPRATDNPRGGGAFPVEGDRWLVSLSGTRHHEPPTDREGFLRFAGRLRSPDLHQLLLTLEPVGPLHGFRPPASRRRHYHRIRDLPAGLVVTADAACTYNPQYGHGMAVAALAAEALGQILTAGRTGIAEVCRSAQKAIHRSADTAWQIATTEDLRHATTGTDARPPFLRLQHAYLDRVVAATPSSEHVRRAFVDTMTLTTAPAALMAPRVALTALARRPDPLP